TTSTRRRPLAFRPPAWRPRHAAPVASRATRQRTSTADAHCAGGGRRTAASGSRAFCPPRRAAWSPRLLNASSNRPPRTATAWPADGAALAAADARRAGWGLLPLAGLPAPALAGGSPPGSLGRRRPDRPEQPRPHLHLPPPPAPRAGLEGHREPQRRAPVLAA